MDADTRHQLKQNEFAQALRQLWDFSDRRTLAWLIVIIVIALGYAGYKVWGWRRGAEVIGAYQTLMGVNATDASLGDAPLAQLRQLITSNSQPGLVAISRLQLARGLEARGEGFDNAPEVTEAESQYKAILGMADAPDSLKAAATFRLGLLYETKRDFAKARETYVSLSGNPAYRGSPFTDLATMRLDQLKDLAVPIKFEPGVKPLATTQPATQPATIPKATDAVGDQSEGPPAPTDLQPRIEEPTDEGSPAPAEQKPTGQETTDEASPTESGEPQ
jgi:predicted negative regulator of RcsB-dependent stress response